MRRVDGCGWREVVAGVVWSESWMPFYACQRPMDLSGMDGRPENGLFALAPLSLVLNRSQQAGGRVWCLLGDALFVGRLQVGGDLVERRLVVALPRVPKYPSGGIYPRKRAR